MKRLAMTLVRSVVATTLAALLLTMFVASCARAQAVNMVNAANVAPATAARDLARGTVLVAADISGDSAATRAIVGYVAKRIVREGELLRAPAIAPAPMIESGSSVMVQSSIGGVTATREGIAMNGGTMGDRIRVRIDGRRTITGVIAGRNLVSIQ